MWREQVRLGLIPYYMFVVRDTGAQHYFGLPLVKTWQIFREAYQQVSGLARTVRGPSMSAHPGKIQVLGVNEINGQKVIALNFLQGRSPDWVCRPFYANFDEHAIWIDDLKPAFGEDKFFFEN
jgi:L-lysine 2,3-aminomutase